MSAGESMRGLVPVAYNCVAPPRIIGTVVKLMDSSHHLPILTGGAELGQAPHEQAIDPVCGMTVDKRAAKFTLHHQATDYYFCCRSCQDKFAADPERYLKAGGAREAKHRHMHSQAPAESDAIYTCPMHPEVRQKGPGACPKCGMALEPESPAAADGAR